MRNKHVPFIPRKEGEVVRWGTNYHAKIALLGPLLGLTPAEITDQQDKAQAVVDAYNKVTQKTQERAEAVTAKNLVKVTELQFLVNSAGIFRRNPLFTQNIGDELGIMPSVVVVERSTLTPSIKLIAYPEYVEVSFNKRGQEAVAVFGRLSGTEEWQLLDKPSVSPYLDTRPLSVPGKSEVREYKVRCWGSNAYIGQDCDIATVVFAGGGL
jgi:hypothetical protein